VIRSFADPTTEDVFYGAETKAACRLPRLSGPRARRKLTWCTRRGVPDLRIPPNRLEALQGDQAAVRHPVNDRYRITFTSRMAGRGRCAVRTTTETGIDVRRMKRAPTHPGEVLLEEFLSPLGMSQAEAARRMGMSTNRLNELVRGKRGVTADTALRLARLLGTSPEFWLNLQMATDLWHAHQAERRRGAA
jgi:addiction module HigA family antidote